MIDVQAADLLTIGLLIVLEGLLSADNALVLALLVLGLPRESQPRALRYGLVAGFGFRILATALAAHLMGLVWVKLAGGLYLAYLVYGHFTSESADGRRGIAAARPQFGLSAFWATVLRVEIINLAFSIDSILVAVALSPKLWVVVTGGILGIVMMRLVAGQMISLIERYPALADGAFIIIGWVAIKLIVDYAHSMHWIAWHIPQSLSLVLIGVIFVISFLYARRHPHQKSQES